MLKLAEILLCSTLIETANFANIANFVNFANFANFC
jgi:hypothetical protein